MPIVVSRVLPFRSARPRGAHRPSAALHELLTLAPVLARVNPEGVPVVVRIVRNIIDRTGEPEARDPHPAPTRVDLRSTAGAPPQPRRRMAAARLAPEARPLADLDPARFEIVVPDRRTAGLIQRFFRGRQYSA